jgi:hypothetical protein
MSVISCGNYIMYVTTAIKHACTAKYLVFPFVK